ncbi:MAG: hypothetical protein ACHP6I_03435 [Rickettsiales bacterium]
MHATPNKISATIEGLLITALQTLESCFSDLANCDDSLNKCTKIVKSVETICKTLIPLVKIKAEEAKLDASDEAVDPNSAEAVITNVRYLQSTLNFYNNTLPLDHPARSYIGFQQQGGEPNTLGSKIDAKTPYNCNPH